MKVPPNLRIADDELDPDPSGAPTHTRCSSIYGQDAVLRGDPDEVDWPRLAAALTAAAEHMGWEVVRLPLVRAAGLCIWEDATTTLCVDSRLVEDRIVAEVLAHEVGHAVHGPRWLRDEEPDVEVRERAHELAANLTGIFLLSVLAEDYDRSVLPLNDITRTELLELTRREVYRVTP